MAGISLSLTTNVGTGPEIPLAAGAVQKDEGFAREIINARIKMLQEKSLGIRAEMDRIYIPDISDNSRSTTANRFRAQLERLERAYEVARKKVDRIEEDLGNVYGDIAPFSEPDLANVKKNHKRIESLLKKLEAAREEMRKAADKCDKAYHLFRQYEEAIDRYENLSSHLEDIPFFDSSTLNLDTAAIGREFREFQRCAGVGIPEKMDAARSALKVTTRAYEAYQENETMLLNTDIELHYYSAKLCEIEGIMEKEFPAWAYVKPLLIQDDTLPYDGPCKETVAQFRELHKLGTELRAKKVEFEKASTELQLVATKRLASLGILSIGKKDTNNHPSVIQEKLENCAAWIDIATRLMPQSAPSAATNDMSQSDSASSTIDLTPKVQEEPLATSRASNSEKLEKKGN